MARRIGRIRGEFRKNLEDEYGKRKGESFLVRRAGTLKLMSANKEEVSLEIENKREDSAANHTSVTG